jgi:hypothetical protein
MPRYQSLDLWPWQSGEDPLEPFATGSFPAVHFNSSQVPFVDFGDLPRAEFRFIEMPARYRPLDTSSDVRRIDGGFRRSSTAVPES